MPMDVLTERNTYGEQIIRFLDQLDEERYYIKLTPERIMHSELVIAEFDHENIIALCGARRRFKLLWSYFLIKREHQGRGLGWKFSEELIRRSKERYNVLMSIVDSNNTKMAAVFTKTGYRLIGSRKNINYYCVPLNWKGQIIYHVMKAGFPLIRTILAISKRERKWKPEV